MTKGWDHAYFGEFEPLAASSRRLPERFLTELRLLENAIGPLTHRFDEANGVIRIMGRGGWTPAEVDQHFARIEIMIQLLRTRLLCIRSLVDLRDAAPQAELTSVRMRAAMERIFLPHDRIAVVVGSSLLKARIRHAIGAGVFEAFLSPAAAETWITAYDRERPVADSD